MNLREINDDLLQDWLAFREEDLCSINSKENKKHFIYFDEICEKILNNVTKEIYNYVSKKLEFIYYDFIGYCTHCNNMYYMAGFSDAIKLIVSRLKL